MDRVLEKLIARGAQAEARARLDRLMAKAGALATENYVRFCIAEAKRNGFDLLAGDIALVHPEDLPKTVELMPRRDPVYAIQHPEVIVGKMLFVKKHLADKYLHTALAKH